MIRLQNGYQFDFVAASGALGYDGRGWLWDWPFRWAGLLDPSRFAVITKTLTLRPRRGNLSWWHPWTCTRLIQGGMVNAVGLKNFGLKEWFRKYYKTAVAAPWRVILSVMPENLDEANEMLMVSRELLDFDAVIAAWELNLSCPNVEHDSDVGHACELVRFFAHNSRVPVIVKLAWQDPYLDICRELDGTVAAFDLINTVPWSLCFPNRSSPLAKHGFDGGVSGLPIAWRSRDALESVKCAGVRTPIISGGGVYSLDEVRQRFDLGAAAVSFGTAFLWPWLPNKIVHQWRVENALHRNPAAI